MSGAERLRPRRQQKLQEPEGIPALDMTSPLATQLLRYLPLIINLVTQLPGFLLGFVLVWLFFLGVVGRDVLQNECAPVAGFHLVALLLLRELFTPWHQGQAAAATVRQRVAMQRSFAQDVQLQWREKLD